MQFKILVLFAGLAGASLASVENDPYLWLEGVDDEKALDWVRAENAETASRLKSNPLFEELYTQAKAVLNSSSRLPDVHQEGDWLYNFWRDDKNPRVFSDAQISPGSHQMNPNGKWLSTSMPSVQKKISNGYSKAWTVYRIILNIAW